MIVELTTKDTKVVGYDFCFSSDNWNKHSTIFVATLYATGLPSLTIQEFVDSFEKFITSVPHPTSKTFKLWHPQMGRFIVVKWAISKDGVTKNDTNIYDRYYTITCM